MGKIGVGTASWTDRTLIESGWYPPEASTPEKRLRYYASIRPGSRRCPPTYAAATHVLFNNRYRDYAHVNAGQLAALL
jgi:hypothetical protein